MRPCATLAAAFATVLLAGCGEGTGTDAKAQAEMRAGFAERPDPATLPADQQKKAAEMKAMAERMAAGGNAAAHR